MTRSWAREVVSIVCVVACQCMGDGLTFRNRDHNPFLGESHRHGLQHVDGLSGALHTGDDLPDDLSLVLALLSGDTVNESSQLERLTPHHRSRPTEYRPALLGLEGLDSPQLIEHGHRKTQDGATKARIHHVFGREVLHAFDFKSVRVAEDDAFAERSAFSDSGRTRPLDGLLLLHFGGFSLTVLGNR